MGYYMNLISADWKIHQSRVDEAMTEIRKEVNKKDFMWVDTQYLCTTDFIDFMDTLRYEVEKRGDYFEIVYFNGEKLGNDEEIFKMLAKYSDKGSFVKFKGEDSTELGWSWIVTDENTLQEEEASICN